MTTDLENEVLASLAKAWNEFLRLPSEHPDDVNTMRMHINAAQHLIFARPARREQTKD